MKKTALLFVSVCIICMQGFSQKADVPADVKANFAKLYPKAEKVKWDDDETGYEAHFNNGKIETSASFDKKGTLVETEKEIELSALPTNVAGYIAKHYPGQKIKEAAEITAANGVITYEAEIKGGDAIFDREGQFVKFNKKDEKKEKDEKEDDKD